MSSTPTGRRRRPSLLLIGLAALAGCATPDPNAPVKADASQTDLVRAFIRLCGQLDGVEIGRRAATYSFLDVTTALRERLTRAVPASADARIWARQVGQDTTLLIWQPRPRLCELGAAGLTRSDGESVFNQLATLLERGGNLVTRLPTPPGRPDTADVRFLVTAPARLQPGLARVIAVRLASERQMATILSTASYVPREDGTTPASPGSLGGQVKGFLTE